MYSRGILMNFLMALLRRRIQSPIIAYPSAFLLLATMIALRLAMDSLLHGAFPFFTVTLAITIAAIFCGWCPTLFIALLGYFLAHRLFVEGGSYIPLSFADWFGFGFYWFNVAIITIFAEAAHDGLNRAAREVAERKNAEMELQRRSAEIDALNARLQRAIQETHHRVKNNLQVIAALTELYRADDRETVSTNALTRIGQHVRTLATLHDLLTQTAKTEADAETVSAQDIFGRLLPLIQMTLENRSLRSKCDAVPLPIHSGASLALLVSELVSNSVKHGTGDIAVALERQGECVHLTVADDGQGFPADFDPRRAANTGLELIESLARHDLQGTLEFANRSEGGACVAVVFPVPQRTAALV
jgi:two-component sensor histidine kinase